MFCRLELFYEIYDYEPNLAVVYDESKTIAGMV
jgi:hypothetical protein